MLATHIPKMLNAQVKQSALVAYIKNSPRGMLCSKNIGLRQKFFAAPYNASDMRRYKGKGQNIVTPIPESFSDKLSHKVKQLLLPVEDSYVSTTPVISAGFLYEIKQRLFEKKIHCQTWVIQQNKAAIANHGEALMLMNGNVSLLQFRSDKRNFLSKWRGNFVQLSGTLVDYNASSGMVSAGLPAITGIGGAVHVLERETGLHIEFALGIQNCNIRNGAQSDTVVKSHVPVNDLITDEVSGNTEFSLLLRCTGGNSDITSLKKIATALPKLTRLAGGKIFDTQIKTCINEKPQEMGYITDQSKNMVTKRDLLDQALDAYKNAHYGVGTSLVQAGFAFLHDPAPNAAARNGYNHAWSEPLYTLVQQQGACDEMFWRRSNVSSCVYWSNDPLLMSKVGKLEVLGESGTNEHGAILYQCKCSCGNTAIVKGSHLRNKNTTSCGCVKSKNVNLAGMLFGELTVLEDAGTRNKSRYWKCQCSCGNIIYVTTGHLKSGNKKSCGCKHPRGEQGGLYG